MLIVGIVLCVVGLVVASVIVERGQNIMKVLIVCIWIGLLSIVLASIRLVDIEREVLNEEVYQQVPLRGEVVVSEQVRITFSNGSETKIEYVAGSVKSDRSEKK